jgi:two-component system LytT family sensor kinase
MIQQLRQKIRFSKELMFQIVFHILVFVFYAINKRHRIIEAYQLSFFLNYALSALFINYFLLPSFFYKKKYLQFCLGLIVIFAATIFVEEGILEKIYFPDTRGKKFLGIIFSFMDVVPVVVILSGFKFGWDALIKQREVEVLQSVIKESELQFLKSQVNPHFLFNNLNNLYAYAIENSPKTPEIILELSSVLRYMLYDCQVELVALTKEVEQMQNFINLNELQIEERGEIKIETKNIRGNYKIAPLILIVFIENAFKHSTASLTENIKIDISVELLDRGILKFICKNNHQPQSNTDNLTHGIGLANVRKRLELLYPNAHQLIITGDENWYEVDLEIGLK